MNALLKPLFEPLLEPLGNWNPQLLRELKGRWKWRNVWIAIAVSVVGQVLLLLSYSNALPKSNPTYTPYTNRYCTGALEFQYSLPTCIASSTPGPHRFVVHWQIWWLEVFTTLSVVSILILLMAGVYLLVSDLDRETRRDTLNFIRLSPRSARSILIGKLLGVPLLLYLAAVLALPLQIWAAQAAGIAGSVLFMLDALIVLSCALFYSAALLFGLNSQGLGGFQAWFLSGGVLIFLMATTGEARLSNQAFHWLSLLNPMVALPSAVISGIAPNRLLKLDQFFSPALLQNAEASFFQVTLGEHFALLVAFMVVNSGLWCFWIWRSLNRCFHNPGTTLLSKWQSYGFTVFWTLGTLGFTIQKIPAGALALEKEYLPGWLLDNLKSYLVMTLLLSLVLMVALSPRRQALLDWARYRRMRRGDRLASLRSLGADLLGNDRSPALLAMGINLLIAAVAPLLWVASWSENMMKTEAIAAIVLSTCVMFVYAAIAQLIFLQRLSRQTLWALGAISTAIVLPPVLFQVMALQLNTAPAVWLLTAFPWASVNFMSMTTILLGILGQLSAFALVSWRFSSQLRRLGESEFKAIASNRE